MGHTTKIATCCYCGTRAALVLSKDRHELTCSSCGAPLHDMKSLREDTVDKDAHRAKRPGKRKKRPEVHVTPLPLWEREVASRPKRKKKSKSLGRRFLSEAFDVIEDIFD